MKILYKDIMIIYQITYDKVRFYNAMSEFPFTLELSLKTCEHLIFHQNQFNLTNLIITFKTANALSQDL